MSTQVSQALQSLKELGAPAQMRRWAEDNLAPTPQPKVNAHIHLPPNFSAFESVAEAVERAAGEGVGVLGVSNYYDYDIYGPFVALARQKRIFPLFGLEIIALLDDLAKAGVKLNDPGNPGKLYLCGKAITRIAPFSPRATELLQLIRTSDAARMAQVVTQLEEVFAQRGHPTGLTEAAVIDRVVQRHGCPRETVYLQERHVCQAFQEALFARVAEGDRPAALQQVLGLSEAPKSLHPVKVQNDIRAALMKAGKPAYVKETFVNFAQARELVLELAGIPCYPVLADGAKPLCAFEDPPAKLVKQLQDWGVTLAEFVPVRNSPETLRTYVRALRGAGIVVTAGTEHNTLDAIPIEPSCLGGAPVPPEVVDLFWEGACVLAAHQFLTLHGETGFVDAQGKPNPAYASNEERIAAFRRLGAAVIAKYQRQS